MTAPASPTQDAPTTDRIEKQIALAAPLSRVWRAITTAREFETWFRITFDGEMVEGVTLEGRFAIPGKEHLTITMEIVRIDPERYFAYRWHPYPVDPTIDYSKEPTTLVEFFFEATDIGTLLKVVESGFDRIPLSRRAEAFRMNDKGWSGQLENIKRHVS